MAVYCPITVAFIISTIGFVPANCQSVNNGYSYHSKLSTYPMRTYQAYHPSSPSHHYTNQPIHHYCNIPPDLWCDSMQAAQQCGVQHQCDALRFHNRKPIKLTLIYEALCPYCQKFISNQLGIMYQQHKDHLELELIPWGNSRILKNGSISCNHGKKECDANRLQSCVIEVFKLQTSGALPFIVCFERKIHHDSVEQAMHSCSAFIRSKYRQIRQCYDGEKGIQLQRTAAQRTMSTKPHPILEVPYLLINDYTPSVDSNNLNVMHLPQLLNKWLKLYS